ncbi:dynein assembly factor 4, axonemal [Betta splendens]|uniref:Dynein axonemal assembly factor 4 n=1 Tax=Betta splendens TaxID=158456 RepID=A0A6P7MTN3_BETSP|nr:dynein assembly factor 4, axonemal [Betta splendens]
MPLLVTDYSWTQTESMVYINVPLKGAKAANVDILSTDKYLKVHFPPYLFEAFLFEPVDDQRSTAKVGNGAVVFSLPKRTNNVWEHLMVTTNDKEKKKEIRHEALLQHQDRLSSESRSKADKKQSEKKFTLETMMKLEEEEKEGIQKMKDAEREKTTAELAAWQGQKARAEEEARVRQSQTTAPREKQKDRRGRKQQAGLPAPRPSGNIHITFTPRVFPTALRESRVHEEEEWLKKQAEARQAGSTDPDELKELKDLAEEHRDPDWLKDKGDKYFAAGAYQSAVNAYSLGIRLNRRIPALFSNRAACHLKLRNFHKAIEDSSQALDLLTPPVAANAAARARASVRRGSAFCQLQLYAEGLQDYQTALRIEPHNEALKADMQKIRSIIQGPAANPGTKHL